MQRSIWKGFITFGLVNIPIILFSAEKKFDIQFKLLDSRDKSRIRYVRINEQTGEEVPWEEVAKGYEFDNHNYVLLKEEDIKNIGRELTKTINIETFVNKEELNPMDFDKPYYVVPDKKGEKGYVILRETLSQSKKVGIAKVVIHTREYLAALMAQKNALILNLLRYEHELRNPSEFQLPEANIKTYKISPKEIEVAKQLVASMTSKWNPKEYKDEFRLALEKWIDEKIHHVKPRSKKVKALKPSKTNVINFVDLLKKSIADQKQTKHKKGGDKKIKLSHVK